MLNYYQPFLLPFLGRKKHLPPDGVKQFFYLSFEDGLWQLLAEKKITKGSTILVPDFYCMDVLENILGHGYVWKMYQLDEHFQIDESLFLEIITKEKPAVILLFHACGITNTLTKDWSWVSQIHSQTLIIEDAVHRLVNPQDVHIVSDQHVLMDSLRKDSPLSGSFMYGTADCLSFSPSKVRWFSWYFISSSLSFFVFRFVLQLAVFFNIGWIVAFAHQKVLKFHDDIIGDAPDSHGGLPWMPFVHQFIDFAKIERYKQKQAELYSQLFDLHLAGNENFYKINIPESDFPYLHVYPVGYEHVDHRLEDFLAKKNMPIWFKFPDCPWSAKRGVLFLPLGFHVSDREIEKVMEQLANYDPQKLAK